MRAPTCLLALSLIAGPLSARQPLVVVSVDGMDNRYLAKADAFGLKIPNIRKLMREGKTSAGVIGAVPTITWPSHTTLITGVDPIVHGILENWRPPGERFLEYSQIKVRTLIGAAHDAGLTVAAINWPATVGAPADWNIPAYYERRRGGGLDTRSVEAKMKPLGLFAQIAAAHPSFAQEWMDDRARTLAAIWILAHGKPDLLLLHLGDLDSEEHANAPYTREAKAVLERTDEFIGQIAAALPGGSVLALVSDHGFERINAVVNLESAASARGVNNLVQTPGATAALDGRGAEVLRELAKDPKYGIGREIPASELAQFPSTLPGNASAVFEPLEGFRFSPSGPEFAKPEQIGDHGYWPLRYRAVFVLWGSSIKPAKLPELSIKEVARQLADLVGVKLN